ncbi:hypothetical protein TELCIR_18988, partial [Teladorsagia circumcincta]
ERPWLWVVYVLCVLIPIILIGVCCFGRKSNADYAADRKKTDAPDIDDEVQDFAQMLFILHFQPLFLQVPNLVDDEEDEKDLDEAEIEEAEQVVEGKHSPHGTPKAEKDAQKVVELEDDEGSNSEPEVVNVEAEEAGPSAAKKSPTVTKRRVRRQD